MWGGVGVKAWCGESRGGRAGPARRGGGGEAAGATRRRWAAEDRCRGEAALPFRPRSLRAFMLYEQHVIDSSRMLVKRFFPRPAWRVVSAFERVSRRPFPKLKPNARFHEAPTFYVANHTSVLADRQPMWWPSHTKWLDFELELACLLARAIPDATPEGAVEAVGRRFGLKGW